MEVVQTGIEEEVVPIEDDSVSCKISILTDLLMAVEPIVSEGGLSQNEQHFQSCLTVRERKAISDKLIELIKKL